INILRLPSVVGIDSRKQSPNPTSYMRIRISADFLADGGRRFGVRFTCHPRAVPASLPLTASAATRNSYRLMPFEDRRDRIPTRIYAAAVRALEPPVSLRGWLRRNRVACR